MYRCIARQAARDRAAPMYRGSTARYIADTPGFDTASATASGQLYLIGSSVPSGSMCTPEVVTTWNTSAPPTAPASSKRSQQKKPTAIRTPLVLPAHKGSLSVPACRRGTCCEVQHGPSASPSRTAVLWVTRPSCFSSRTRPTDEIFHVHRVGPRCPVQALARAAEQQEVIGDASQRTRR